MTKKKGNKYQAKNYFNFIHCCALACVISFQTPIQMQASFFNLKGARAWGHPIND